MDPLSIIAGAGQIVTLCCSTTTSIVRWSIDVRTADERIRGFYDEVTTLERVYVDVKDCLITPMLREAAEASYQTDEGRRLWTAVRLALDDSQVIMTRIVELLDKINRSSGIMRRPRMQFEESVRRGELGNLRDRLRYFNANIALSIQMVTCMTQQEHRSMTQTMQQDLDIKFHKLEAMMADVRRRLDRPSTVGNFSRESTLVMGSLDGTKSRGKDSYLEFAKRFVTSASAVASTRSNLSTISPPIETTARFQYHGGIAGGTTLAKRDTITQWASDVNVSAVPSAQAENGIPVEQLQAKRRAEERNYRLAEGYLKNGPEKSKAGAHESAEKNFRHALAILAKHDFSGRISFHPAEIILMLAQSCLKQQKHDDCIDMLKRVSEREENIFPPNCPAVEEVLPAYQADILQSLAACHQLADVYRQKGDYEAAKDHALRAYDARTDTLGESDDKTIESLELLIEIYHEMGDEETAEAYKVFLDVNPSNTSILSTHEDVFSEGATAITVPTVSPPASEAEHYTEKPTANQPRPGRFKSMFGRPSVSSLHDVRPWTDPQMQPVKRHTTDLSGSNPPDPTSPRPVVRIPTRESKDLRRISTSDVGRTTSIDANSTFEEVVESVHSLCMAGKQSAAWKLARDRLQRYGLNTWPIREEALRKNIENGKSAARGLAATGKGYAAIHLLCEVPGDHHQDIAVLLEKSVDLNSGVYQAGFKSGEVFTPILLAISKGNTKISLRLIQQHNIKLDCKDRNDHTPLLAACRLGNIEVVATILDKSNALPKEYPENWYGNLLIDAARHCDLQLVELLLNRKLFDVNKPDSWGKTALMYAIIKKDVAAGTDKQRAERARMLTMRLPVARKLLDHNADVSVVDNKGNTAATYAQMEGDEALVDAVGAARFELAETVPRYARAAQLDA